ncbi:putative outer membrane protein, probably involved in nutrient binding [Polaribacter irgensii 23-P]|uniref:Putative outer membrane protein, probably involved in nutrient binding n=1 Tax=Polaribacter irgensii 23-P TaxID=313594 RepID=A4BXC1_9FLAO|nr:carboxypeptidase-like regulatory domain-containing protein [Polaribacter irgensii]EAR13612.1 putative outer membrane protein, probably involved in nutrient binding [Polaribacter irgensii 23-P]
MCARTRNTILLFLLSISFTYAQNPNNNKTLSSILTALEKKYDIKFSFSDVDIENIFIAEPPKKITKEELLVLLNKKTQLQFTALGDRYVTISFLNKMVAICGTILDADLSQPLLLASIKVNGFQIGTTSDAMGTFYLKEVPIKSTVSISFVGYKTKQITAKELFSNTTCAPLFLIEKVEELSEITMPRLLTSGLQKKADGSIVLNTEKFGILPGLIAPDILKTIKILPGIESVNENISNINVRGGTSDQNLMLWDGIKMYHSGHFFGLISAYNPYLTKKVSVTKNGTSSAFSDGVSATVNMETNDKITNILSGGAGFNLLSSDAFVEVPIKKDLAIHVSARRSFTDLVNTPTYANYFSRSFQDNSISSNTVNNTESNFYFYDYSFKLLYDIGDNHKIRANFIHIKNSLEYVEQYNENALTIEENSTLKQENLGGKIGWNANWNSKFSTNFSAFFSNYKINSSDYNKDTDQFQTQFNNVLETAIRMHAKYELSEAFFFSNGFVFNEIGIKNTTTVNAPTFSKKIKNILLKSALYSEIEYNKKNTYIRFGIRANYFDKFKKLIIEPRIAFRQEINAALSLSLEGEFKNQTTAQKIDFEDNFLGIEKRRWILSDNKNTPIIKSKQASVGIEYNQNSFFIDLTGFYKKVSGITAANQGFYNNTQNLNSIGNYEVKGIEFLINKQTEKFSTWFTYTYSKNQYAFDVFNPRVFTNSLDLSHSLSTAFNYDLHKNLKISFGGILRSGKPYTKPIVGNETIQNGNRTIVNYDSPNKERLANFIRLDLSASYHLPFFKNLEATLRIGFTNITNQKNILDSYYIVDTTNENNVSRINNFSLPFTPDLSFRVQF